MFIDEIHRLSTVVEEYLYAAMEDYRIDIMIDSGPSARSIQINLNPFTLIGATTRSGLLTAPLLSRFAIKSRLEYYSSETLKAIILRAATILKADISKDELRYFFESTDKFVGVTTSLKDVLFKELRNYLLSQYPDNDLLEKAIQEWFYDL